MEYQEQLEQKVKHGFIPCFDSLCPLHEQCMRWQGREYLATKPLVATVINQSNPDTGSEHCPMFSSCQPMRMAYGFTDLLNNMPLKAGKQLMNWMVGKYFRTYAYEYRSGKRPISPRIQQQIIDWCRQLGYTAPIKFDEYKEEYEW